MKRKSPDNNKEATEKSSLPNKAICFNSNRRFLDAFVDFTKWKYVKSIWNNIGQLYEHTITHRPLCVTKGGSRHSPTLVGVIIFHRPPSAQMNIKMECMPNMAINMVSTVEKIYSEASVLNPVQEVAVWNQFVETYINDMTPRLIIPKEHKPKPEKEKPEPEEEEEEEEEKKEEEELCSVCDERPSNTTTSCGHRIVCQACSDRMKNRPNAHFRNHCVICQQKLEFVVESNDDIRIIN